MAAMRYAIVIEKAPTNYAAYVPDLPGCIATGSTVAETEYLIREAIEFISKVSSQMAFQSHYPAAKSNTSTSQPKIAATLQHSLSAISYTLFVFWTRQPAGGAPLSINMKRET